MTIPNLLSNLRSRFMDANIGSTLYRHFRNNALLFALCALFATSHMLWHGYSFGLKNHGIQIPMLKSYFHPELYPNDAMVATRSHYLTFNYMFFGALEKVFGHLELIVFSGHWLMRVLFFMAIYQFALAIFKSPRAAIIAMFLMFPSRIVLATSPFIWTANDFLTHTFVVMPFILWGFRLFVTDRTRGAYALLGFAANINIQTVTFVLPMFALVSLLRIRRMGVQQVLKDFGVFALCGAPCLIWAFATASGPLTDAWIEQMRVRSSGHSFPFSWSVERYIEYLLFFTLGVITWALALRQAEHRRIHIAFGWFSVAVLLLCGIGVVFAEWIPVKLVLRVQLFRSTKFLTIFTVLYASYAISCLWDKSAAHKLLALSTFLVLFIPAYWPFLVLLPVLYLLIETKCLYWWAALTTAMVLILRVYAPHPAMPDSVNLDPIASFLSPFLEDKLRMAIVATFLLWLVLHKGTTFRGAHHFGTMAVFLVMFGHVLPATYHRMNKPIDQRGNWIRMQGWVKDNTPQDAMFLTPPYRSGFRVFSERSTVVEWNDGTQQYFDPDYSYEWWARMTEIGRSQDQYGNLSPEKLTQLAKKYGASYLVFPVGKPLPFQQVYADSDYGIYALP